MPLYEFECKDCNKIEEVFQSYKDPAPVCEVHKKKMKRLLSKTAVRTKGAGLYSLDSGVSDWGYYPEE